MTTQLLFAETALVPAPGAAAPAAAPAAPSNPGPSPAVLGKKALSRLAAAMFEKDAEVRAEAASAWGAIGNPAPAAIKLLHKALRDRNAHVRVEAAYSLHLLGDDSGLPVIERIVRPSTMTAESMEPEEQLHLMARSKSRVHGIKRLSQVGGAAVFAIFDKLQKDPSGEIRDAVNIAAAKMNLGPEYEQPFIDALGDGDETVRAAAVKALAEIGNGPAIDALNAAALDPSVLVREEAMRALAQFSSPDTVRLLVRGANDPDKRVAAQALAGLAHIPDGATEPLLNDTLKGSKAPEVQLKAMAGLARRGDKVNLDLADYSMKQKDPDLRVLALDVLEAVATPESNALLLRTLENDRDGKLRVDAARILVLRLAHQGGSR